MHTNSRYVNFKGCVYTALEVKLRSGESQFILGKVRHEESDDNNNYPNIKYLEYNFLSE